MARIRSLKPELPSDAALASVPRDARLTFVYLISQADDYGLVPAAPRQLLGLLYPHDTDVTWAMLESWIDALQSAGVVRWRDTNDGQRVVELVNWTKHQRIDNRGRSTLFDRLAEVRGEIPRVAADRGENPLGEGEGKGEGKGYDRAADAAAKIARETDFEIAWKAYPRRPGNPKGKARRAYMAARLGRVVDGRARPPVEAAEILAGVENYAAFVQREGTPPHFVKHAATFFGPDEHWRTDYGPVAADPYAGMPAEVLACRNPDGTMKLYDDDGNQTAACLWLVGRKRDGTPWKEAA
jgi:hypothetical protein